MKSKSKVHQVDKIGELELAREDWDFPEEEAVSGATTLLRAQLLWEICRHLVIDSSSGGIPERSAHGPIRMKPNTSYDPFGRLGPKFSNYFPGGSLAVSAVVGQFLDQQGTEADLKFRIRKGLPAWLPCNFPAWNSPHTDEGKRERFVQLAWQNPVEVISIKTEGDIEDLCRSLKQQLRNTAEANTSFSIKFSYPITHLAIRPFAWDHYQRTVIDELIFEALRGMKLKPKGITEMQLRSKLMDLRLLRLVLAYGKEQSRLIVRGAAMGGLSDYGTDKKPWSPDWSKKCNASLSFLTELFPNNQGISIMRERFSEVTDRI